jgi:hypothetical protein
MPREKEWTKNMRGGQLLAPGDIINLMEQDAPIKARVLSCLALGDGSCMASLEILEGERKGQRLETKLQARSENVS